MSKKLIMAGKRYWRIFITSKTNKGLRPARGINGKVGSCSFGLGWETKHLIGRIWWIRSFTKGYMQNRKKVEKNSQLNAEIKLLQAENEKKDKQYAWLQSHYDRCGEHLSAYTEAVKVLVPENEHYKFASYYFAKILAERFKELQADMVTAQAVKEQLVWDKNTLEEEVVELQDENKEHKKLFRQILSWTENVIGTMLADKIKEALKGSEA